MVITAEQHEQGIKFTTDGNPISRQRKVTFRTKIPNQPETEETITYLSDAALVVELVDGKSSYLPGDVISLRVIGGNVPYDLSTQYPGILIERVEGSEDLFTATVKTVVDNEVIFTATDSDNASADITVQLEKFNNLSVIVEPEGVHYNKEDIYYVVQGTNSEVTCTCDDPRVVIERSRSINSRFRVYLVDDSNTGLTTNIRFTAVNENDVVLPLEILPLVNARLTHKVSPVKPGEDFIIIAENIPENLEAYSSSTDVSIRIEKQVARNTYHIICSCDKDIDSNISIYGRGIVDTKYVASFIKSDQFYLGETSVITEQIKLPYKVKVFGVYDSVSVSSDNPDIIPIYDELNDWLIIEARDPNFTSEIQGIVTLSHASQKDIELNVVLVPSKNESKPVMGINGKTITKPIDTSFFINVPMLIGNETVTATCDDPDCSVSVHADRGNRIYINATVPKVYTIKVKHSRYREAEFKYDATPLARMTPSKPSENNGPIYDLGVPPTNITVDTTAYDYVSRVFAEPGLTDDKLRCAFVIANGPASFKNIGHNVCDVAIKLDPANPLLTITDGITEIKELYGLIKNILSYEDYLEFKESLLLVLKLFKVYKDNGLNKSYLFKYNNVWGYDLYNVSDYVRTINFITDYVEKDGQNINPFAYDFDLEVTQKLATFCNEGIRP